MIVWERLSFQRALIINVCFIYLFFFMKIKNETRKVLKQIAFNLVYISQISFHFLTIVVLKTVLIYLTTQIYLEKKKVEYNKIHARYSKWKLNGKIMKMAEEIGWNRWQFFFKNYIIKMVRIEQRKKPQLTTL